MPIPVGPKSYAIALGFAAALVMARTDSPAMARSLDSIRAQGSLNLCAHPNSLPFASKTAEPPGFQVELGRALAQQLGVALRPEWVITIYQARGAGCDIVLDAIADAEAQGDTGLRTS